MIESDDFVADDFEADSDDFVADDFEEEQPERSGLEKVGRLAGQYGLGAVQGSHAGIAYDVSVAPLGSKGLFTNLDLERMGQDIEFLAEKNLGKPVAEWDPKDRELYEDLSNKIQNPQEVEKQFGDTTIRGISEKATGVNLHPEDMYEKAANWAGFIKDPRKLFELGKTGLKSTDLIKAIAPTGKEALRGLGAGAALQYAEEGNFGPIGTMAAAVIGDIGGNFGASLAKGTKRLVTEPRKVLAEVGAKFAKKEQADIQKAIINDFRKADIQADIGTITDSELVKWVQSRLAQSGLTGKALDDLKTTQTNQIKEQYKNLAESVGEARFTSSHEAGEVAKTYMRDIRDADLAASRNLYQSATSALKEDAFVNTERLGKTIEKLEKKLKPGNIKSNEQSAVLGAIEKLKRDIYDSEGNRIYAPVKSLINDKIALNDVINYEVQGGAKQFLKELVADLDRTIVSHGKENPKFAKNFIAANKNFSQHAKTFRNKSAEQLLNAEDPTQIMNKMNSVHGIRSVGKILGKTAIGESVFDSLKRLQLDKIIGDNLVDSTTQQIKHGTFSKLLQKGKNKEIIKEILPKQSFNRLQLLQKNAGKLADSAQKFLNASKSGVTLEDAGVVAKVLTDLGSLMMGNPWPLLKTGTGIAGARYLTKLIGDPDFLKLVEEFVLASDVNNRALMQQIGAKIADSAKIAILQTQKEDSSRDSDRKRKL